MAIDGQLLYRGYVLDEDLVLDLYGHPATEDAGYEVTTATLENDHRSLARFLTREELADMSHWLDRRPVVDQMEGLIARIEQDRQMRKTDNQWRQI